MNGIVLRERAFRHHYYVFCSHISDGKIMLGPLPPSGIKKAACTIRHGTLVVSADIKPHQS